LVMDVGHQHANWLHCDSNEARCWFMSFNKPSKNPSRGAHNALCLRK
jgi:hypothetical protein